MFTHLLTTVSLWIESVIARGGYGGIVLLMALESACIPLPSEVIMPFAGALTLEWIAAQNHRTTLNLFLVALAGAIGCVLGSALAYGIGATGGREVAFRYGRYVLLRRRDLERAERWFAHQGAIVVFVSRLLPVVRTFISLPAGVARMPFISFLFLTFLGSLPWCLALAWLGVLVGGNLERIKTVFHGADALIVAILLVLLLFWIRHHLQGEEA
ncbi:uncharacterized membrane-associated protein [Chthonomonas calidirosea]|uniref:DedA family protein n=1 Tax=Chthonomonas calidirosea TaxID=454171 RepID=UPI0006DD4866|nr:DedA family protein [Chthonomonas calidirosea]CEK17625.1 uncharacterized membrane-associated protein [Chthonomonas calidirosea]